MAASYPLPKFHFEVTWGSIKGSFTEVTGLSVESKVIEYRAGDDHSYIKTKQAGLIETSKVTLKRGTFAGDNDFYDQWVKNLLYQTIDGSRASIQIKLLDETKAPKFIWTLAEAWAPKVTYGDLKADANEVAIESIEIVHEGLSVVPA